MNLENASGAHLLRCFIPRMALPWRGLKRLASAHHWRFQTHLLGEILSRKKSEKPAGILEMASSTALFGMNRSRPASLASALILLLVMAGCQADQSDSHSGNGPETPGQSSSGGSGFTATVHLDVAAPGRAVETRLVGSNIQWVDHGDDLLTPGTGRFDPAMLAQVKALGPTSLRYPGGSQASVHHWREGVGPFERRGKNQHFFSGREQTTEFGTGEFLELCRLVNAEPLISVNVLTGTPEEAAAWVAEVNRPGLQPRVAWWELDNEPYLREEMQRRIAVEPAEFARRASSVIAAMRVADPRVKLGLPLRSDMVGGIPATHFPGYSATVLAALATKVDFIALHNAYLPLVFDQPAADADLFRAAMAGFRVIADDLEATRRLVERYRGSRLPFAITEFNAMFGHNGGPTDGYIRSLGGAVIVADLLRVMSEQDDVVMAHFWSLSGNGHFGTISNRGQIRASYRVLQGFRELLQGRYLPAVVMAPSFSSPRVGVVPPQTDVPLIAVRATRAGEVVRLMLINKAWDRIGTVTVDAGKPLSVLGCRAVTGGPAFAPDDRVGFEFTILSAAAASGKVTVELPPHAVIFLDLAVP